MRGAEGWTDHRLIRSKIRLTYKPPRRVDHGVPAKLATSKLIHCNAIRRELDAEFGAAIRNSQCASIDESWRDYARALHNVAQKVVGPMQKRNQDWFDEGEEDLRVLFNNARQALRKATDVTTRRTINNELKAKTRELKNRWWTAKAIELQRLADKHQIGNFYENLRTVFGPKRKLTAPIYSRDHSQRLTDSNEVLLRWAEHFNEVLNPETHGADLSYISSLQNMPKVSELDDPPSYEEFTQAIHKIKNNKTPGSDSLPAEVYKYGGPNINNRLFELILRVWESKEIPQDWKDASICKLYKGKGNPSDCSSYRGISLLSAAGKVLSHIINKRLSSLAERILPESQCGFRPNRGTVDAIFVLKQLQEKSLEQHRDLYVCFVDLEKAFDRVPRAALWIVLERVGCPGKFIDLIRQFHDGMMARVRHNNNFTRQFPVTSGVKQGCVMAPTLFAIYFAAVMNDALQNCRDRISLNVRSDKGVFDLSRFRAKRKVHDLKILETLYADDICLMADSMQSLQSYLTQLEISCRKYGLVISVPKTQVLKQPARGVAVNDIPLMLGSHRLDEVSSFRYLGSVIRSDNRLETELATRIAKAASAFGGLYKRVWNSHDLQLKTKISVYKAIILPILLYASETWVLYKTDIKRLDSFHMKCLRTILRIKWQDHVPNSEVLRRSRLSGLESLLTKRQLRWCGHLVRMENSRLPRAVFYAELQQGKRKVGGQYLRYKDVLKKHLSNFSIPAKDWEGLSLNRHEWRRRIAAGSDNYEQQRLEELDAKRLSRKTRLKPIYNYTYNDSGQLYCRTCDRTFKTKFGFASHIRAHART